MLDPGTPKNTKFESPATATTISPVTTGPMESDSRPDLSVTAPIFGARYRFGPLVSSKVKLGKRNYLLRTSESSQETVWGEDLER